MELLGKIPETADFSLVTEYVGRRYFCSLRVFDGHESYSADASSETLDMAMRMLSERFKQSRIFKARTE